MAIKTIKCWGIKRIVYNHFLEWIFIEGTEMSKRIVIVLFAVLAVAMHGLDSKRKDIFADTWTIETVNSSSDVGEHKSIAIDASDNIHISYYDNTNKDLKYATNTSGSWQTYRIDTDGVLAGTHQ